MTTIPRDPDLEAMARSVVVDHGAAPGAVVAAAALGKGKYGVGAFGQLAPTDDVAVTQDTLFDLASLTKPATALVAAKLVRAGRFSYDSPLGHWLPYLPACPARGVGIDLLLAHRSGLAGHVLVGAAPARTTFEQRDFLRVAVTHQRAACSGRLPAQGFAPVYSDLGYMLAGAALAVAGATDLGTLVGQHVNKPLGLRLVPAQDLTGDERVRVAPTEWIPLRGGLLRGVVHDENAWVLQGRGLCGHAGLFGTASDVLRLGVALVEALNGQRRDWLTADELSVLTRPRPGGSLRAGFDGKSGLSSSAGTRFGPSTFGHLGFTGTSLWMDPDNGLVGVLLSNRVCPTRWATAGIRSARPAVYNAIAAWAGC